MRLLASLAVGVAAAACLPSFAHAKVHITVDLDAQSMHVEGKDRTFDWKVSSGAAGYDTPAGSYGVLWTDKDHKSDEYDGAPMPNAIFFKPGFAIHGAYKSNWGHPASHGCVRLPVAKSAILWELVKAEGGADITITGAAPETRVADRPASHPTQTARAAAAGAEDFYGYAPAPGYAAVPPPPAYGGYAQGPNAGGYAQEPDRELYGAFY